MPRIKIHIAFTDGTAKEVEVSNLFIDAPAGFIEVDGERPDYTKIKELLIKPCESIRLQ